MSGEGESASPSRLDILVRGYASGDYSACRSLWVELTEQHRRIYQDNSIGGDDPGSGFDSYLEVPERVASWVAESAGAIVGCLQVARQLKKNEYAVFVTIFCDSGDKYLSERFWQE